MASPEAEFKLGLARLSTNSDSSDFTITCGPHTFKVHKAILSSWSKYFETACQKGFKETHANTIDFQTSDSDPTCDDPEAVKCMVHFFYHFDYEVEKVDGSAYKQPAVGGAVQEADTFEYGCNCCSRQYFARNAFCACGGNYTRGPMAVAKSFPVTAVPDAADSSETDGNTLMHAKVFAVAVKYQIPSLRRLAAKNFAQAVKTNAGHPDFARAILITYTTTPEASTPLCQYLTELQSAMMASSSRELSIKLGTIAYKLLPQDCRELRDVVTDALHTRPDLLDSKEVEKVVRGISGLTWELFRKKSGKSAVVGGQQEPTEGTALCPSCSNPVFSDYCYNCGDN